MNTVKTDRTFEAVTVSVDYSDFLAHTIPFNKPQLDRWVIVTSRRDTATRRLCDYWHLQTILTEDFYTGGEPFNKARGINAGLRALDKTDWIVHLDADIVLPPRSRFYFEHAELDPTCVYGIDRLMCDEYEKWQKFLQEPEFQQQIDLFLHMQAFPVGTRIVQSRFGGYVPIGFFQMFHASAGKLIYPETHGTAARTDVLFALQWPRPKRHLLPETVGIHLATDTNGRQMGANWCGRVTSPFGPPQPLRKGSASHSAYF